MKETAYLKAIAFDQELLRLSYIPADLQLMLDLRELIDIHFKEQKKAEFYSDQLSTTVWILNPICKSYYNKTVYGLIIDRMLREALILLRYSKLNVRMIAFEMGFADPGNFSRFFLRETGKRPGSYRKKSRT